MSHQLNNLVRAINEEIVPQLPKLKSENKTLIIVSHDDSQFFSTADRVIKMEHGKLFEITK